MSKAKCRCKGVVQFRVYMFCIYHWSLCSFCKDINVLLPLYIAYIHTWCPFYGTPASTVSVPGCSVERTHSMRYSCRDLGHDTTQINYRGTSYEVIRVFVKCTQKFRANTSILMMRVAVAFIFSSFWLKFFVQHSMFAEGREMRSFFLHRTFYEVLRVTLTNLALPCPGPSQFFTSLLRMKIFLTVRIA